VDLSAVMGKAAGDAGLEHGTRLIAFTDAVIGNDDEVRALRRSSGAHYVPVEQIPDPTVRRALARPQMEFVAARVSALNECFY